MALRLVGAKPLPEPMPEIVNWTPRKEHQWVFIDILYTIQENAFEHVICGTAATLVLVTWVLVLKSYAHMSLGKYTLTHYDALRSMLIFVTHLGHLTHICIGDSTIIVSDNGLSPNRCQAIFWTGMGKLLIGPLETNFNEISIEIQIFSFIRYISKGPLVKGEQFESASMYCNIDSLHVYSYRRHLMKRIVFGDLYFL